MTEFDIFIKTSENTIEEIALGLSPGETRQFILDELRTFIYHGEVTLLNKSLKPFKIRVKKEKFLGPGGVLLVQKEIEEAIYALPDTKLVETPLIIKKDYYFFKTK